MQWLIANRGMLAMLRWQLVLLLVGVSGSLTGCRACNSCHDYDPPVAASECARWGGDGRAGSFFAPPGAPSGEFSDIAPVTPAEFVDGSMPVEQISFAEPSASDSQ
jgi:hypothetical protein